MSTACRLRDCPRITMFGLLVSEKPTSSMPCFVWTVRPEERWRSSSERIQGASDAIVRDDRQNLVPGVRVVLVPDPARRVRSDLFRAVRTDADGRIHMEGIPPGDYTLFSWEEVEEGAWQDPNFLSIYEPLGKTVRIGENGRENVELRLIPFR